MIILIHYTQSRAALLLFRLGLRGTGAVLVLLVAGFAFLGI